MTLLEILAVITILSIVMLILTSILSNGLNVSDKQKSKSSLQQQANYVLVVWREFHEEGNPYKIIVSEDQTKITFNLLEDDSETIVKSQVIEYPNYLFTLYVKNNEDALTETEIDSKFQKVIPIEILIKDANDESKKYQIKTTLSRL